MAAMDSGAGGRLPKTLGSPSPRLMSCFGCQRGRVRWSCLGEDEWRTRENEKKGGRGQRTTPASGGADRSILAMISRIAASAKGRGRKTVRSGQAAVRAPESSPAEGRRGQRTVRDAVDARADGDRLPRLGRGTVVKGLRRHESAIPGD